MSSRQQDARDVIPGLGIDHDESPAGTLPALQIGDGHVASRRRVVETGFGISLYKARSGHERMIARTGLFGHAPPAGDYFLTPAASAAVVHFLSSTAT